VYLARHREVCYTAALATGRDELELSTRTDLMMRAILSLRLKPGRQRDFEAAWLQVAEVVRQLPGNTHQALLRDTRDSASYVITSDWVDSRSFHEFERSAQQEGLTWALRELRESASMTTYEIVASACAKAPSSPGTLCGTQER
jgi:heme-degrading monooxygenase HmoA